MTQDKILLKYNATFRNLITKQPESKDTSKTIIQSYSYKHGHKFR
jgi:hypothetical protein